MRYDVFVVPNDGSLEVKIGEFQYISDAIVHINRMKAVYVEQKRYDKACVRDSTFGDGVVVYEQLWRNGL